MSSHLKIAVLPGDHIGPEITDAAVAVLDAANDAFGLGLSFEYHSIGHESLRTSGTSLTSSVFDAAVASDAILLGPCDNGGYPALSEGGVNVPGKFRHDLDLYANIRPSKSHAALTAARPGLDVVICRENSEGFYPDRNMYLGYGEMMPVEGVALSVRRITACASNRIARIAFEQARRRRKLVTIVCKKHIFKMTDGLFYDECIKVSKDYPDVECNLVIADAFNADLYLRPERYDVAVMTNLIGDVISNLASALAGGLGLGGGLNAGSTHAMANASHGSAPDIAGQNKANPISMVRSGAMLLGWLGQKHDRAELLTAEKAIEHAVEAVLSDPSKRTTDVGGTATCSASTRAIVEHIRNAA